MFYWFLQDKINETNEKPIKTNKHIEKPLENKATTKQNNVFKQNSIFPETKFQHIVCFLLLFVFLMVFHDCYWFFIGFVAFL